MLIFFFSSRRRHTRFGLIPWGSGICIRDRYVRDKTAIFITQKNTLLDLVDRVIVMHEGKIYLDGPKNEVLAKLSGQKL